MMMLEVEEKQEEGEEEEDGCQSGHVA